MHKSDLHLFIEGAQHLYRSGNYQRIFILCLSKELRHNIVVLHKKPLKIWQKLDTSIIPKERRTRLLQKIEEEAESNSGTVAKLDPVELIREDRRR